MIKANAIYDKDNNLRGFECLGHAGYAENGYDIICASVSALAINCINSIQEFTTDEIDVFCDENSGDMRCTFKDVPSSNSLLLLESLFLGLKSIEDSYTQKYIKVKK